MQIKMAFGMMLVALALASPVAADSPEPGSGDQIFGAVQKALLLDGHPRYASYDVEVAFTKDRRRVRDSWHTIEDFGHATILTAIFSSEERANPSVPQGSNVVVPFFGNLNRVKPRDPVGEVAFALDQTFGISPQHSYTISQSVFDLAQTSRTIPIIGGASTNVRRYRIDLVGTEQSERGAVFHLALTPLINPGRDRLRELWIATDTLAVRAAVIAGIGNRPPMTKTLWRAEFEPREGATYLAREIALAPLDYGRDGPLTDVTIDFADIHFASRLPNGELGMQTPENPVHDP